MKKVVLSFLLIQIAFSYFAIGQTSVIQGFIQGIGTDTIFIKREIASSKTRDPEDTLIATDGRFKYQFQCNEPILLTLYPKKSLSPVTIAKLYYTPESKRIYLFVCPNDTIEINGSLNKFFMDYSVKGSKICEEICMFHKQTQDINIKDFKAALKFDSVFVASNSSQIDELASTKNSLKMERRKLVSDYITENPNSDLSAYFLILAGPEIIGTYMNTISPEVRNGIFKKHLQERERKYQNYMISENSKNKIFSGALAPDFNLKDINGKSFTLSKLKGKFVVLDFWASWCSPCIKGFPMMKEYYEKYKSKVEFVGIICDDKEIKWKEILRTYELKWLQLLNNDAEVQSVSAIYSAESLPTKVIIDQEGKIISIYKGEIEDFYNRLDEILTTADNHL